MKIIYLLILISTFTACGQKKPQKKNKIGDKMLSGEEFFIPSDAMYKFKNLNSDNDILYNAILEVVANEHNETTIDEQLKIRKLADGLFKTKPHGVVEWNIDDSDFCKTGYITTNFASGGSHKSSIKVCNSVINNDVMNVGSYYSDYQGIRGEKDFVTFYFYNKILKTLDKVAYYDVTEKLGKQKIDYWTKLKHLALTDIFIQYTDYERNTIITKKISDTTLLYSDFLNFSKSDFVDYKTVNTELIPHLKEWIVE
jgi:hypothetical protein